MAESRVLYEGDGTQDEFNVPFPFLSPTHVIVELNTVQQTVGVDYVLSNSTVQFLGSAPRDGDAVLIRRATSPFDILVDFQNGSTLDEADLDTAYLHNFYLLQEAIDGINELINGQLVAIATGQGIFETDSDGVIAALVNAVLNDQLAATLQQRISDIDDNAEAIVTNALAITDVITGYTAGDASLAAQISAIAGATANTVFVQPDEPVPGVSGIPDPIPPGARWFDTDDNLRAYLWDDVGLIWLDLTDPNIGINQANIASLQVALGFGNGQWEANALAFQVLDTTISTINGTLASQSSDITNLQSDITAADADIVANAQAVTNLTTRVTATESDITSISSDITSLQNSLTSTDGDVLANATALGVLTSRVDVTETGIASNAASITGLVSDINATDTDVAANAAAISSLSTSVSSQGGQITSLASDITSLTATVGSNTASVTSLSSATATLQGDVTDLEARYGVQLNVNGYVTGFEQFNNGDSGTFQILADKFFVVDPASNGQNPTAVFGIQDGNVYMQNAFITNAWIEDLTVTKLTTGTLNADMNLGTGVITWNNGSFMKVSGIGFGSNNQFLEWFGPYSADLNTCTEQNAKSYSKTNGEVFISGTLTVGDISNSGQTSDTAANALIDVGPFGTQGGPIVVNRSYSLSVIGQRVGNQTGVVATNPTATVRLRRALGAGGFSTVQTDNLTGTYTEFYDSENNRTEFTLGIPFGGTYTDSDGGLTDRTFRYELTARNFVTPGGTSIGLDSITQALSIVTQENT